MRGMLLKNASNDRTAFQVTSFAEAERADREYWRSRTLMNVSPRWNSAARSPMDTIRLPADFRDFLRLLNLHRVEYLLIGGYAVCFHGS